MSCVKEAERAEDVRSLFGAPAIQVPRIHLMVLIKGCDTASPVLLLCRKPKYTTVPYTLQSSAGDSCWTDRPLIGADLAAPMSIDRSVIAHLLGNTGVTGLHDPLGPRERAHAWACRFSWLLLRSPYRRQVPPALFGEQFWRKHTHFQCPSRLRSPARLLHGPTNEISRPAQCNAFWPALSPDQVPRAGYFEELHTMNRPSLSEASNVGELNLPSNKPTVTTQLDPSHASRHWSSQAASLEPGIELLMMDSQATMHMDKSCWPGIDGLSLDRLIEQTTVAGGSGNSHLQSWDTSWRSLSTEACVTASGSQKQPTDVASTLALQERQYVCWLHGCNGRTFTNFSNYRRHCKERSDEYAKPVCPRCGREFLRETARDSHYQQRRCRFIDVDGNGVHISTPMNQKR
nr:hypothetical protein CFP56_77802 [Quercus suber]